MHRRLQPYGARGVPSSDGTDGPIVCFVNTADGNDNMWLVRPRRSHDPTRQHPRVKQVGYQRRFVSDWRWPTIESVVRL